MIRLLSIAYILFLFSGNLSAQTNVIEIGESMEDFIKENHIESVEKIIHSFTSTPVFLEQLLEQGHDIAPGNARVKRKDVKVGKDIDIYVKHFTEHQNFTMFLVPVNFYAHAIYDTLLISVLEVSDEWLHQRHYYADLKNDSIRSSLLSMENHEMLAEHMYHQSVLFTNLELAEVEVKLHESYMSNNSIKTSLNKLTKKEKEYCTRSWGMMKRLLSHNVALNAEMNVYGFGSDDMEIDVIYNNKERVHIVTPGNIFTRHHFEEDE